MTALRLIPTAPEPTPQDAPKDITAMLRAEIRARNWAAVHIAGDRRQPLFIADAPKRTWANWVRR